MELNAIEFHLLNRIYKSEGPITKGKLSRDSIGLSINTNDFLASLKEENLVTTNEEERTVELTEGARKAMEEKESLELNLIRESVYDNFEFALIQFFYNKGIGVFREDIPEILKKHAPKHGTLINDGMIVQYLHEKRNYIDSTSNELYQINEEGRAYFEYLLRKRKNSNSPMTRTVHFHITNNGDGNVTSLGNNSPIAANQIVYKSTGDQ